MAITGQGMGMCVVHLLFIYLLVFLILIRRLSIKSDSHQVYRNTEGPKVQYHTF